MAYTKTTWVNNQAPAINAKNLNKIEDGIYNSVRYADAQTLTEEQKQQARANIAAAPDGFGLGLQNVELTSNDNLDNVTGNGWYHWGSAKPVNTPALINAASGAEYCAMFVIGSVQIVFSYNDRNNMAMRSKNSEGWTPWEYINPPLKLGKEYRTTERYNGAPVYVKMADCGAVANKKTIIITSNKYRIIDVIIRTDGLLFPMVPYNSTLDGWQGGFYCDGASITLYAGQDLVGSNQNVQAIVKFAPV